MLKKKIKKKKESRKGLTREGLLIFQMGEGFVRERDREKEMCGSMRGRRRSPDLVNEREKGGGRWGRRCGAGHGGGGHRAPGRESTGEG